MTSIFPIPLSAQVLEGFPYIRNIYPKEYGYESQNFSITQDSTGRMFIANLDGILIYDGAYWDAIPINGIPYVTYAPDHRVYVTGYNFFGYIEQLSLGHYEGYNLLKGKTRFSNVGDLKKPIVYKDFVFFVSESSVYAYDMVNDTIEVFSEFNKTQPKVFTTSKEVFWTDDKGITLFSGSTKYLLTIPDSLKDDELLDIVYYSSLHVLVRFKKTGFYRFDFHSMTFEKFNFAADAFLKKNSYVKTLRINNNLFVTTTRKCGLLFFKSDGSVIGSLNEDNGLISNNVTDLFIDNHKNIWIATSHGISVINSSLVFTFINSRAGLKGSIADIIRFKNRLLIATLQGVYEIIPEINLNNNTYCFSNIEVKPITGLESEIKRFLKVSDDLLLIASNTGLYSYDGANTSLIDEASYRNLYRSLMDSSIILGLHTRGLNYFKISSQRIYKTGRLKNLNSSVRTLAQDGNIIWLGTDYQQLYKIKLENGTLKDSQVVEDASHLKGLPKKYSWIDVYKTGRGLFFSTSTGVYHYSKQTDSFFKDTLLGLDFADGKHWIYPLVEDGNKNLWFSYGHVGEYYKHTYLAHPNERGSYNLQDYPFNQIRDFTIEAIYPENDSIIWFGSSDGLVKFDFGRYERIKEKYDYTVLIHSITIGKDSVLSIPNNYFSQKKQFKFPFKYRDIRFELSVPNYITHNNLLYFYDLEGYSNHQEKWTALNFKEYTNLPYGRYILHVKVKDFNNKIVGHLDFKFYIKAPYYLTWYAYLYYLVLFVVMIQMLLYWRAYFSEKEKFSVQKLLSSRTEELVMQKERAEDLLAKILPEETARQIQETGQAVRKEYKMVTVLFADIKGFTTIAANTPSNQLLDELDTLFLQFDSIVEQYNIEKIKTIGDAYMCAGGIPKKNRTNPIDVVMAGIEMLKLLKTANEKSKTQWEIRIGIHTGPVIAGTVGSTRISYDIWGDAVNVASRMESSGRAGEINISEDTYELVMNFFDVESRGKLPVKHKGELQMYFVKGIKKELAKDDNHTEPNKNFFFKLQKIRYYDLEDLIFTKLERGLPDNLYYHNLKHTIDVVNQVEVIARGEGCSSEEILLLKTAALFHDTGFLIDYQDHEEQSIKMAREILPLYKYTEEQIQIIARLIYATKLPPNPQNKLEEIMCDADLDYLGRKEFVVVSQDLYKELFERGVIRSVEEWNKMQVRFIENHQYFTKTARNLRRVNKLKQLEAIRNWVEKNEQEKS